MQWWLTLPFPVGWGREHGEKKQGLWVEIRLFIKIQKRMIVMPIHTHTQNDMNIYNKAIAHHPPMMCNQS